MSYVICGDDNGPLRYGREAGRPKHLCRTWKVMATGGCSAAHELRVRRMAHRGGLPSRRWRTLLARDRRHGIHQSAGLGTHEAIFDNVPLHDGAIFTIVAARGDEEPELEDWQTAQSGPFAVSIAPNPTTDGRVRLRKEATVRVTLSGMDGHQYATRSRSGSDYYAKTVTLPSRGVWIVTVESGEDRRSYKLIRK